jgi:TPR repeat protein
MQLAILPKELILYAGSFLNCDERLSFSYTNSMLLSIMNNDTSYFKNLRIEITDDKKNIRQVLDKYLYRTKNGIKINLYATTMILNDFIIKCDDLEYILAKFPKLQILKFERFSDDALNGLKLLRKNKYLATIGIFAEENIFLQEAEHNNMHAQYNLGLLYCEQSEFDKGIKWLEKSAEHGHLYAQYRLGFMYETGKGVKQDFAKAFELFEKSANQGNIEAQGYLGIIYYNGIGVKQDLSEAFKWFKKSAEQYNIRSQCNLGVMYEKGYGVKQDFTEAINWYQKATDQGDAQAQFNMGNMYISGIHCSKDLKKAEEMYKKAVEQNHNFAMNNLGYIYVKLIIIYWKHLKCTKKQF